MKEALKQMARDVWKATDNMLDVFIHGVIMGAGIFLGACLMIGMLNWMAV